MRNNDCAATDAKVKALMGSSCWRAIEAFAQLKESLRTNKQRNALELLWPCVRQQARECGFSDPVIGAGLLIVQGKARKPKKA